MDEEQFLVNWAPFLVVGMWKRVPSTMEGESSWVFSIKNEGGKQVGIAKVYENKVDSYFIEPDGQIRWLNTSTSLDEAKNIIQDVYAKDVLRKIQAILPGFDCYPVSKEITHA